MIAQKFASVCVRLCRPICSKCICSFVSISPLIRLSASSSRSGMRGPVCCSVCITVSCFGFGRLCRWILLVVMLRPWWIRWSNLRGFF